MIENEEPEATQIANLQISPAGHKLPEQSQIARCSIPRPFGFEHLIHQWQPMGIRVLLNLPFTGNDKDYLFAIRNGPFIPPRDFAYTDSTIICDPKSGAPTVPDLSKRQVTTPKVVQSYAFNNMRPVIAAGERITKVTPDDAAVYITYYDQPPNLSTLSTMFRKWRGSMHYRIRTVAGFTTQGYIFSTLVRNVRGNLGVFPTNSVTLCPQREDQSYRETMLNSYIMGDTAMFRHFEFQVPFEYPIPYYDQFAWIGNRSRPARNFASVNDPFDPQHIRPLYGDPVGDNYILIGLRGRLESSVENAQIAFELEYRAGDDFQFSDPFLPNSAHMTPNKSILQSDVPILTIPSNDYSTDGIGGYYKVSTASSEKNIKRDLSNLKPVSKTLTNTPTIRRRTRDIGVDEVDHDDLESLPGDLQEVLDLKRNLRKSLNRPIDPTIFH